MPDLERVRSLIRSIPDFPQPGILFRDITPLLHDPGAFRTANDALAEGVASLGASAVAGIEARGFIFGVAVAERLQLPFVPVRRPGKLPAAAASVSYELEYGANTLELHRDPEIAGDRVLVVDDLLATGGTAAATARLVTELGATVAGFGFLVELAALEGRSRLEGRPVHSVITY